MKLQHAARNSLILLSTFAFSSCDPAEKSFTSEGLARNGLPTEVGQGEPLIIAMKDGTMMAFVTNKSKIDVYKTSIGFAEQGSSIDLRYVHASSDRSTSGIYNQINYLEALALFDNNWQSIYDLAKKNQTQNPSSVDPEKLKYSLSHLVAELPKNVKQIVESGGTNINNCSSEDMAWASTIFEYRNQVSKTINNAGTYQGTLIKKAKQPVLMKIPGTNDLLMIKQVDACRPQLKPTDPTFDISFARTAQGYAVQGTKVSIYGFGLGTESSSGMTYTQLSPREAIALFENKQKITDAVVTQGQFVQNSVELEKLTIALSPGYTNNWLSTPAMSSPSEVSKRSRDRFARDLIFGN